MNKIFLILTCITIVLTFNLTCTKFEPSAPPDDELLDGPVEGLTPAQNVQFIAGDIAFNDEMFTVQTGLGPIFVATSCGSCHPGDGKGHPFTMLIRYGQSDSTGNLYLSDGGPQLQNRAIPNYSPEQIPAGLSFTRLMPPSNTGLGFIELVPEADIIAMSDPTDMNDDGISGVPNWNTLPGYIIPVNAVNRNGKYLCRFGKKASVFNLLQQTAGAYNQDIGITTTFEPADTYSGLNTDPEVSDKTVRDVVAYLQTLKAPIQRDQNHSEVIAGSNIFVASGCADCHKQTLKTGFSEVAALSEISFHPYTDLLLHDMGPGLDDGYTEGTATTSEWRTAPLWGIGLSPDSQGNKYFLLHDGRAKSIEQAIELHGGEATSAREKYIALPDSEKTRLIRFLESL